MDMTGEVSIPASRDVVWAALNNPETLKACIPGCEELTRQSDTQMTAIAVIRIGPVSARFNAAVTLSELDPPNAYRITGEGQGGVAGHARGSAMVKLTEDGENTLLSYTISAQVGGKLAQLGGRMIDATSKTLSAVFFKNLEQHILAQTQGAAAGSPDTIATGATAPTKERAAATRPVVQTPARSSDAASGLAARRIALIALVVATFAALLAWFALGDTHPIRSDLGIGYASTEFGLAVHLLIVLAIGYLLGRSGSGGRNG
jgi:carbon monoxide dehydrogenase subunit G